MLVARDRSAVTTEYVPAMAAPVTWGYGTIFRWSLDGTYSRLRSLSHVKNDGNWPANQLVEAADGQFLGATRLGGRRNAGTVYRVTVLAE